MAERDVGRVVTDDEREELAGDKLRYWELAGELRTDRINYLRGAAYSKGPSGGNYPAGVKFGMGRLFWWTRAFQEDQSVPWGVRRAKAMALWTEHMPLFIIDHSQIYGYIESRPYELCWMQDISHLMSDDLWYDKVGYVENERDKEWGRADLDWWRDKDFQHWAERYLSPEEIKITKLGIQVTSQIYIDGFTSAMPEYEWVHETGYNKIWDLIEDNIEAARTKLGSGHATPDTHPLLEKIDEWEAQSISAQWTLHWGARYARLARIVAENFETDPVRKEELLELAACADRAIAEPTATFREAVQKQHLIMIAHKLMERSMTGWGYRMDQTLWPYYKKDVLEDKTLTRREAQEYIEEMWIRTWELDRTNARLYREIIMGGVGPWVITIGGVKPEDGSDACNELTDVICDSMRSVRVSMPSLMYRWHPNARLETVKAVFGCIKEGMGSPSIHNDKTCIDSLMNLFGDSRTGPLNIVPTESKSPGITLEEARSWCNVVCMSPCPSIGGRSQGVRYANSMISATKCVELALYDGFDPLVSKVQLGPHTGNAAEFKTYEEFARAWEGQYDFSATISTRTRNICRFVEARWVSMPMTSTLFRRCVESGINCIDPASGECGNPWVTLIVSNDVGDCLYAVKKVIFEDKKYTMAQLVEACKANWEGYDDMRKDMINAPKWGNDIDAVDEVCVYAYDRMEKIIERNIEWCGQKFTALPQNASTYIAYALRVGALTNGRRWGEPLYDGGCSAGAGFDKRGPTALLRSCSKIDYSSIKEVLLNQRLNPAQLKGDKGFQMWVNYMKTWYDLGVGHIQFNMVDNETLRAAQKEPEKYQELVVRVAGYSALFVELSRICQDSIIQRNVNEL